jgi:SAM-dependent methyltransferase
MSHEQTADVADFRTPLYARYVSAFKDGKAGDGSAAWWDDKYLPLLAAVDRAAPVLDLGCGDGRLLAYLRSRGFADAVGVDVSAEQVSLARARGVRAEVGDAFTHLGTATGEYAAIFAVDVFEHFSRDELMRFVPLLFAALAPGGTLLVQTANGAGLFPGQVMYGDLTHLTILTPESLRQLLRPAGFVRIDCVETGPIPLRVRGKLNVALWIAIRNIAAAVKFAETGKRQTIWTENFIARAIRP